jgi:SAM-dependent methyltransferase
VHVIPFQLHRRIPFVRRPFYQRDQAMAERDRAAVALQATASERDKLSQENSDLRVKLATVTRQLPTVTRQLRGEKSLSDLKAAFLDPLVDLGAAEDPAFFGIFTPSPEVGQPKFGVNEAFLADAESYYAKFQSFQYWHSLLSESIRRSGLPDQPDIIVEFGCGFGNSTFPLLELFPDSRIIATDISPNLLSILRRLLDARDISSDRCLPVAMDAQKPYIASEIASLVFGSAIMHHLADPGVFVAEAMRILRPGGAAVFFEPMEAGFAIVREACMRAAEEGERRGESGPLTEAARITATQLAGQILRDRQPNWRDQDDKWAFPPSVLERIASAAGAELVVYPINNIETPFRSQIAYILEANAGIPRETVPDWFWAHFDHFDKEVFSPKMLENLPIEACIIFKKRVAVPVQNDQTI